MKLTSKYYQQSDVLFIAQNLLGKIIYTKIDGKLRFGMISETEAYAGVTDRASHAFNGRRTARTETMFQAGGVAYIYLCYGVHHLFNVVTNEKGIPDAVLIRGVFPVEQDERGQFSVISSVIANGPGKVSGFLGITKALDGIDLTGNNIWIEDRGIFFDEGQIKKGKRIGVDYAGEDAHLEYRYWITDKEIS